MSSSDTYAALVHFARRYVDADTAQDLVQEAFVRAMEAGRIDIVGAPLAYLRMIVRNLAFDTLSKRTRDRLAGERSLEARRTGATAHFAAQLDDDLRDRLAELSKRQWESLVLTVVKGMTEHEAASAVDVSRSAVAGSRDRALDWLRRSLPPSGPSRLAS
ncbi:MAG: sigma-70 family RNA polymerase sigma factor [Planctomycetota bacterium]|nr:sigma-70 family RNA polymerase sigma factor [Planctomycetota bacterium]